MGLRANIHHRSRQNINIRELTRIIGFLILVEALFMLVPFLYSLFTSGTDTKAFAFSIGISALTGSSLVLTVRPRVKEIGKRDGMLLTVLVWVIFSVFGMLPFMLCDKHLDAPSAFFESMSGFTTTGATVIGNVTDLPEGILLWRCMMQWLGGVGIIIFTVALIPMLNSSGGMQMFNAEATGITHDKLQPRISQTAKRLWLIYSILTVSLCLILWLGPMSLFDSVCHSMSTVSTGGFSTSSESIGAWNSLAVRIPIIVFMFLGGVSFVAIYRASMGHIGKVWRDENFRTYTLIVVGSTVFFIIALVIKGGHCIEELLIDPLFQVVSTITSTGYTVEGLSNWGEVVIPILFVLMFMGSCAGSTAGGVKVDRVIFIFKNAVNEFKKVIHPNRFYPLTINGVVKPPELVSKVTGFFAFYSIILLFGGLFITIVGLPLQDAYFATFSCLGNTGLGIGVTESSYEAVPAIGKIALSFFMLVGRLEIFTVIILFSRGFWHR